MARKPAKQVYFEHENVDLLHYDSMCMSVGNFAHKFRNFARVFYLLTFLHAKKNTKKNLNVVARDLLTCMIFTKVLKSQKKYLQKCMFLWYPIHFLLRNKIKKKK